VTRLRKTLILDTASNTWSLNKRGIEIIKQQQEALDVESDEWIDFLREFEEEIFIYISLPANSRIIYNI
jgi:hypothetical protein